MSKKNDLQRNKERKTLIYPNPQHAHTKNHKNIDRALDRVTFPISFFKIQTKLIFSIFVSSHKQQLRGTAFIWTMLATSARLTL
jgi:hypothetical protein